VATSTALLVGGSALLVFFLSLWGSHAWAFSLGDRVARAELEAELAKVRRQLEEVRAELAGCLGARKRERRGIEKYVEMLQRDAKVAGAGSPLDALKLLLPPPGTDPTEAAAPAGASPADPADARGAIEELGDPGELERSGESSGP